MFSNAGFLVIFGQEGKRTQVEMYTVSISQRSQLISSIVHCSDTNISLVAVNKKHTLILSTLMRLLPIFSCFHLWLQDKKGPYSKLLFIKRHTRKLSCPSNDPHSNCQFSPTRRQARKEIITYYFKDEQCFSEARVTPEHILCFLTFQSST